MSHEKSSGGGGGPSGPAGGVLGGTYPDPLFAEDMATQIELNAEIATRAADDLALDARIDVLEIAPPLHAATHKNGGSDEVATYIPAASAIPKASLLGWLDSWLSPAIARIVDITWSALAGTTPTTLVGYGITDAASDTELTTEINDRTNADAAHAALTITAHGGIVANTDPRLTDARVPTAHAVSHQSGGIDPLDLALLAGLLGIGQIPNDLITYNKLQNAGANVVLGSIIGGDIVELPATADGRSIIAAANFAAMQTLLSLVPGTNVQPFDAELAALATTTSAADKLPYYNGVGTATTTDLSAAARSVLDDLTVDAIRTTIVAAHLQQTDIITASGTYNIPAWAVSLEIELWGAGGGGGSGRRGATLTVRGGGGGGGTGGHYHRGVLVSNLGGATTLTITIGNGGAGGAARTTDDTNGASGSAGSSITQVAIGGGGAALGTANAGSGGSAGTTIAGAGGGAGSSADGGALGGNGGIGAGTVAPGVGLWTASGGGGGGGITNLDAPEAGGAGGANRSTQIAGSAGGAIGTAGTAGSTATGAAPGTGGGGGGSSVVAAAGAGGAGGLYGGGGGGGGASQNGFNSGAGSNGQPGVVIIIARG